MERYVLSDTGQPVPESDLMRWGECFEDGESRRVAADTVGEWRISTVFLAIDHSFGGGPPVLWESMVFGPEPWDDYQERYTSRADAEAGHKRIVQAVTDKKTPEDMAP